MKHLQDCLGYAHDLALGYAHDLALGYALGFAHGLAKSVVLRLEVEGADGHDLLQMGPARSLERSKDEMDVLVPCLCVDRVQGQYDCVQHGPALLGVAVCHCGQKRHTEIR